VEEYGWNFKSFWDTVEAFRDSPGLHRSIVEALMKDSTNLFDSSKPTDKEIANVENEANEAVKGVLLISGADK
jgi:hypothetical protein